MTIESNKPSTILVVDDSQLLQEYIRDIFKKTNFKFYFDCDGSQLFNILENQTIDVILMDIILPKQDGYSLCKKIKQHPKFKDTPVIFLSSLVNTENIVKAFKEGGVDYITKPFEPEELIIRVQKHIDLKKCQDRYNIQLKQLRESNRYLMGTMHEMAKIMEETK